MCWCNPSLRTPHCGKATCVPYVTPNAPTLPDWQQRVVDEKKQLDERLEKLVAFIGGAQYAKLADDERELLLAQRRLMGELSAVLGARILRFRLEAQVQS